MPYRDHKTKLVCTIGPASATPEMMFKLISAGMDIARLNYSHGDFASHAEVIKNLRFAANQAGRRITIMADLPGPKIRLGKLKESSYALESGDNLTLSTRQFVGDASRISVSFAKLPRVVHAGDIIYLNDGIVQVKVLEVQDTEIRTVVLVGGELRSHKGLNLPGINLGISAFTKHDRECLKSALENGVDAISQSFVDEAKDVIAVRKAAAKLGYHPFIIAKIERLDALPRMDEILAASDGVMIARGDLGVEIPIERLAVVQKQLIARANLFGKPVITATQMLESMLNNPRPTRAEATDVANAVLDGTDCLMLSEESAIGNYPLAAVTMLGKIAAATEPHRNTIHPGKRASDFYRSDATHITDVVSHSVYQSVEHLKPSLVVAQTVSGHIARMISRFKLPVWITALSRDHAVCQALQFSYGVFPLHQDFHPVNWREFLSLQMQENKLEAGTAIVVEGPSPENPDANHRVEIVKLT